MCSTVTLHVIVTSRAPLFPVMAMPIQLFAAGSNAHGQLANGTLDDSHKLSPCIFEGYPAGSLPHRTQKIVKLVGGANHTLALLHLEPNGLQIWGCGDGRRGQLGPVRSDPSQATSQDHSMFKRIPLAVGPEWDGYKIADVAACWETSFVVLRAPEKNDILLSMGSNDFGVRGWGRSDTTTTTHHPSEVRMDHLFTAPALLSIESIACGPRHVMANLTVISDKSSHSLVVGWGAARHGQIGVLTDRSSGRPSPSVSIPRTIALRSMDDPIAFLAAGAQHSVLMHASGRLTLLGADGKAQLRGLDALTDVRAAGCTWNGSYIIRGSDAENAMFATGSDSKGQLGVGQAAPDLGCGDGPRPVRVHLPNGLHPLRFACGSEHILCLCAPGEPDAEAEVWGWGWNEHGNLGLGTTRDAHLPVQVWPPVTSQEAQPGPAKGWRPVGIWAGCGTSWIALEGREKTCSAIVTEG